VSSIPAHGEVYSIMSAELDLDFVNFASARINFLPVIFTLIYIWLLYNMIYHIFCKNMVHFLFTIQGKGNVLIYIVHIIY
jgi:hypothetical protein